MNGTFRQQLDRWLLRLTRASIQGGAIATKAFFAAAGANAVGLPVAAINLKQATAVFLFGAGYALVDFLVLNPLGDPASVDNTKDIHS